MSSRWRLPAAAVLLLVLGACSSDDGADGVQFVREATVAAPLPAPTSPVVLDVLRDGAPVASLDVDLLERMETVEAVVLEPFLQQEHRYTGVAMPTLLEVLELSTVEELHLVALDDYSLQVPPDLFDDAILATREDGGLIELEQGGPIRVVFVGDSAAARNTDNWIWSLRTVEAP